MNAVILCAFVGSCIASAASAQSLVTGTNDNGLDDDGSGVYFNLTAGPTDLTVTDLTTSSYAAPGTSVTFELHTRVGSYTGGTNSSATWTSVGTASGIVSSATFGTFGHLVSLDFADFDLSAGQVTGIALFNTDTGGIAFSGLNSSVTQNFSDGQLSLFGGGAARGVFTGASFTPRVFSGTINYIPAPASAAVLGLGGLVVARRRR